MDTIQLQLAVSGHGSDLHGRKRVGGGVVRIGEPKLRSREGVCRVLISNDLIVGACWFIVDGDDIDSHRVRRLLQTDATLFPYTTLFRSEGEVGVRRAALVRIWEELEVARVDVGN